MAAVALPAASTAVGTSQATTGNEVVVVDWTQSRAAIVSFSDLGTPVLVSFLEDGWTAALAVEGERYVLRLTNADGNIVGEHHFVSGVIPSLEVGDYERPIYSPVTTPVRVAQQTGDGADGYSVGYCNANQVCVQTRIEEGCSDCIEHWGKIQYGGSGTYYFDGCSEPYGCSNIAQVSNPSGYYDFGWRCKEHDYSILFGGNDAWSRIIKGGSVLAQDNAYPVTYWNDKVC